MTSGRDHLLFVNTCLWRQEQGGKPLGTDGHLGGQRLQWMRGYVSLAAFEQAH